MLRARPHERSRMTQGRCGSLLLHRVTLSFTTPRRFNPAHGGHDMHWIVTLIVGAVVGWLTNILIKTNAQMGAIANIVVGIIGSSLGFWLAGVLGLSTGGPIVGWVVAVLGAALLIFILKAVGIFT